MTSKIRERDTRKEGGWEVKQNSNFTRIYKFKEIFLSRIFNYILNQFFVILLIITLYYFSWNYRFKGLDKAV